MSEKEHTHWFVNESISGVWMQLYCYNIPLAMSNRTKVGANFERTSEYVCPYKYMTLYAAFFLLPPL